MNKRAFTFIELIIAAAIFSIIAVSVYSVFNAGVRVWLKTNPIIEGNQSMRVFFNMISVDLKNAVIYSTATGSENFKGEANEISFITLVNVSGKDSAPHAELARVSYSFGTDKDKKTVNIKRLVAARDEGLDEFNAKGEALLSSSGISEEDVGFEYCYKESTPDIEYAYEWKNMWDDTSKIPRGVSIKLGEFRKVVFIPTGELGAEK